MLIIDGHEDLAWNAVTLGRDLTAPVATIRAKEGRYPAHREGTATVSLPALRQAGVRIVFATIFVAPYGTSPTRRHGYHTPEEAYHQARAQLEYYHHLQARGEVTIIRTQSDLRAVLDGTRPSPGVVLLMEGADALRAPDDLAEFVAGGVRMVGLSWKGTRYAGGTGHPGPLTALGRALLREMDRLGVVLDASHLAEASFWQALGAFRGYVIASHSNARALVPTDRQLSDGMIRAIADRGGVIGVVWYNPFIKAGWTRRQGRAAVRYTDLVRHLDHMKRLAGTACLALGSDLDGGIGRENMPYGVDTVVDLLRFAETLGGAGYTDDEVRGIMGENWLRLLRKVLPE